VSIFGIALTDLLKAGAAQAVIDELPECTLCGNTERMEISIELVSQTILIWCGCGNCASECRTLHGAIRSWAARNIRVAKSNT